MPELVRRSYEQAQLLRITRDFIGVNWEEPVPLPTLDLLLIQEDAVSSTSGPQGDERVCRLNDVWMVRAQREVAERQSLGFQFRMIVIGAAVTDPPLRVDTRKR